MSMLNPRFIEEVANTEGLTKAGTKRLIDTILYGIVDALETRGQFSLPGVGILKVVKRKARTGRNPQTGDPVNIPEKWDVKIRTAPKMKQRLNSSL